MSRTVSDKPKSKTTQSAVTKKNIPTKDTSIEKALARNDEEWMKRMLLLVMIMIIALLGL